MKSRHTNTGANIHRGLLKSKTELEENSCLARGAYTFLVAIAGERTLLLAAELYWLPLADPTLKMAPHKELHNSKGQE
jgi:hypothetical protein